MKKNNSFLKNYKNLRVLVTGSTGFKGAWLSNWLLLLGAKVIGVGLKPEKNSIIFQSLNLNNQLNSQLLINSRYISKLKQFCVVMIGCNFIQSPVQKYYEFRLPIYSEAEVV